MAIPDSTPTMKAVVSLPISQSERANPFASAKQAAAAASVSDQSPFAATAVQETALAIRTPSPDSAVKPAAVKKVSFSKKLFSCACVRPAVFGEAIDIQFDVSNQQSLSTSSNTSSLSDVQRRKGHWDISPRKSLMKQSSCAYTDVDW